MNTEEFDDIRPYYDEELPQVLQELAADPAFRQAAAVAFPGQSIDALMQQMCSCKTKDEFQERLGCRVVWNLAAVSADEVTFDIEPIDPQAAYTYISNHRDIVLDSGFLSASLIKNGMPAVEIAIGDNLLIHPWIKKLVRVNKSFIVQRALTMRQMLESSIRMSRYMHYTIGQKKQSIWIAQREGRAKDADDRTQESIVKMLAMGGEGDLITRLLELNIMPLAISYEYDPCDYLKARELQLKRDVPDYKKTAADDLLGMRTGMLGRKGRVHLQPAGRPLNTELQQLDRSRPKAELTAEIARLIDRGIHRNYRLYANNYVACDLLQGTNRFADRYTPAEKQAFESYVNGQLDKIDLPNKDLPFLRGKILTMYANPLLNYLAAVS